MGDLYVNRPLYLHDLGNAWLPQPHCNLEFLSSSEYLSKQLGLDQMRKNEDQSQDFEDCYWYLARVQNQHLNREQITHDR